MIDVKVSNAVDIVREANDRANKIMVELRVVCKVCREDEKNGGEIADKMVLMIAEALVEVKDVKEK